MAFELDPQSTGRISKLYIPTTGTATQGEGDAPISSGWAYDHGAAADPHPGYILESAIDTDLSSVSASDDTVPSAKATKAALDLGLLRTEGLVETAIGYNSSSLTASGLTLDCTAALTVTLETYSNRSEGFQFAVIASGGEVTFAGTYDKKSTYTKLAQGDTAWVIRKSSTWHVSGLSS